MNRKRTFVILGVIVLLFLGIFTFAQESNEKDPKKNDSDGSGQVIDDPTKIDEEKPEEIISNVIPRRTTITPDTIAPVIVLNGEDTIYIDINSTYEEKGAIITDNRDSDKIATINGVVNTNKAGKYTLTYSGIDAAGNVAIEIIRTVYVRPLITATSTLDTYETGDPTLPVINATVLYDNEVGEQNITPDVAFDPTLLGTQIIKFNYNYEGVDAEEKTITILVQDTTAPSNLMVTLNVEGSADEYIGNWTNKKVIATLSATDNGTGIKKFQYSFDNGITWNDSEELLPGISTATIEFDAEMEESLIFKAVDNAGLESVTLESKNIKIDRATPVIALKYVSNAEKTFNYVNLGKRVAIRFCSNEKLDTINSVVTIAGQNANLSEVISDKKADCTARQVEYLGEIFVNSTTNEGIAEFVLNLADFADNKVPEIKTTTAPLSRGGQIIIDTTAPKITIKSEETIGVGPYSNISFKLYDENKKELIINGNTIDESSNSEGNLNGVTVGSTFGVLGMNTITLTDKAGNETTLDFYLDNVAPTGSIVNGTSDLTNQDVIATLTVNEPIRTLVGWNKTSDLIWTKPIESNTTQTIEFYDLAGNKGTASLSVGNIDKEKPVITFSGNNPLTLGCITNFDFKTAASATDNHDGNITSRMTYTHNFIYGEINIPFIGNVKGILPGNYSITYTVTDSAGNSITSTRNVIVKLIAW